jgi:hypothetical protein
MKNDGMILMIRFWLTGLILAALLQACHLSSDVITPLPARPTAGAPTELPTLPSSTITPIPEELIANPKKELVNCRFGPGTMYAVIGEVHENQTTSVAGKNLQGTWWYVHDPGNPGGFCWVAADVIEVSGNVDALPIVQPPFSSVTNIDVTVDPNLIVVSCDAFPQVVYFTAEITVNGPALVTYRWEVSTGVSSTENAFVFDEAGTKTIQEFYRIASPNDYWIRLHALGPNDKSGEGKFRVACNP